MNFNTVADPKVHFLQQVGKLSQLQMHTIVEFLRHEDRVSEIFSYPNIDVKSCFGVADGCLQVAYQKKGETI